MNTHDTKMKQLEKARRYARKVFNELNADNYGHPSHDADQALNMANEKFGLNMIGTEGWCDDVGRRGVTYLNAGDTYEPTIAFVSERRQFLIADMEFLVRNYG
jgi:hypothetical protein